MGEHIVLTEVDMPKGNTRGLVRAIEKLFSSKTTRKVAHDVDGYATSFPPGYVSNPDGSMTSRETGAIVGSILGGGAVLGAANILPDVLMEKAQEGGYQPVVQKNEDRNFGPPPYDPEMESLGNEIDGNTFSYSPAEMQEESSCGANCLGQMTFKNWRLFHGKRKRGSTGRKVDKILRKRRRYGQKKN